MIPNGLAAAIAFRWFVAAAFALAVFARSAPAQPAHACKAASIDGVYNGTYAGENGATPTKFKLTLTVEGNGTLAGTFTLYVPDGSATTAYTCDVKGRYIAPNRMVQVI